jgi:hypothetical protein
MNEYRLYFLDEKGAFEARQEFEAPDDAAALMVADFVFHACSDACASFELWQGRRLVMIAGDGLREAGDAVLTETQVIDIQHITIGLEEALQRDHWLIARSTTLVNETRQLKEKLRETRI